MCTCVEVIHTQSSEKKCPECANDVEVDLDWVWMRDLSSILSKSLGVSLQCQWTDPTSLSLHWDGFLIQFLLSSVQIVILCRSAVGLRARTILFWALATVRVRSIVIRACEVAFVIPLTSNLGRAWKFAKITLIRLKECTEGDLGRLGIVLRSGSMLESCCVAVLAPLKWKVKISKELQLFLWIGKNSQNALIQSLIPVQPNTKLHGLPL